jgi:PAS domain S-box-containing protein
MRGWKVAGKLSTRVRRALIATIIGIAITTLHAFGYLAFFDARFDELRFNLVRSDPSPQLAIVAIDAQSLNDRPVWPWPRSWHAQAVDQLLKAGAGQIVLDIDFSAASTPKEDAALAEALKHAGNRAILPVFRQQAQTQSDIFIDSFPLAAFAKHTRIASANIQADADGIVRRMSRLEAWGNALVPTFATAAAGDVKPGPNEFLIDYGIRADQISTISVVDVLNGRIPPTMLAGKTVFVGATALELGDVAATPVNGLAPGVTVQALATSSLLQGRALQKAATWLILTLTIGLFYAVEGQCQRRHWLIALGLGTACSLGMFGFSIAVQAALPVMIDVAPLVLSIVVALFASLIGRVRDLDVTVIGQAIALRRSSSLMRRVVENTFDGLVTLDLHGTIKSVNPAAERIIGRKAAELVERPFATLIPSLSPEKSNIWLAYLAEERQPQEISLGGPDGQTVATEIAVTRLLDEPSVAFIAVLRDITERKTAMAAAARNLSRLKDAIDSVSSGFALFDAEERLVLCNQNFRDLYPTAAHFMVPGWRAEELIHAATACANPGVEGHELARLTTERLRRFRNPGQPFEISIGSRWVLIDERRTSEGGAVGIYTDITQGRKQELELRTAHDQAQAANRSKSQFLANMSHELRTPLNAVIGFSDVMKAELMGPLGTDVYRGYVKDIHDSASHLLSIINDILDVSSIEAGMPRLRESSISPVEICRSVATLMSGKLEEANITMTVSVRGLTGGLWADARLIKQMLINLISNSIKFSAANTRILLSVTQAGDQRISFSVADEGIGIALNDLDRILRPFEQVANALTRDHEGVGLGLSLVKSMIEAHGGTLDISSVQHKGTTVTITFPPERLHGQFADVRPSSPLSRAANDDF